MTHFCLSCAQQMLLLVIGIVFVIGGAYLYLNWFHMFTDMRAKNMALRPTSSTFPGWQKPTIQLYFDIYFFNWTNPEDFLNKSMKPSLKELGPYRFREEIQNVNITWHSHNSSVSYRKKSSFHFHAEGSHGSLDDLVTIINPVAYSAAQRASKMSFFQKLMLEASLSMYNEELTVTKTVDELSFKGYLDDFLTFGIKMAKFSDDVVVPYDRVGFLYTRNASELYDGNLNIFTGADDIKKMGKIHEWNYKKHNGIYPGSCGEVKGSMGQFFEPNLTINDTIFLYIPKMCQAIPLEYTETVEIHGVKGYKYSGGKRSVDNGSLYSGNECFCVNEKCELSGVINISPCAYNASIYMSYPHFYQADEYYINAIDGMNPIKDKHELYMTLEPISGIILDVGGGFQTNILVEPIPRVKTYQDIPRTFLPIMWCEERFRVLPEMAKEIAQIPKIHFGGKFIATIITGIGISLIVLTAIIFLRKSLQIKCREKSNQNRDENLKKQESQKFLINSKHIELIVPEETEGT